MSRIESHAVVCGAESNSYPTDQETESVRSVRKKIVIFVRSVLPIQLAARVTMMMMMKTAMNLDF